MKELLKQVLMEYKENHKEDQSINMDRLNYLIEKNEKDYLCNPYLAVSSNELENHIEWFENEIENCEGEEQEEKKERLAFINEHYDEIVENLNNEIMAKDYIWQIYSEEIDNAIDRCMTLFM